MVGTLVASAVLACPVSRSGGETVDVTRVPSQGRRAGGTVDITRVPSQGRLANCGGSSFWARLCCAARWDCRGAGCAGCAAQNALRRDPGDVDLPPCDPYGGGPWRRRPCPAPCTPELAKRAEAASFMVSGGVSKGLPAHAARSAVSGSLDPARSGLRHPTIWGGAVSNTTSLLPHSEK